MGCAPVRRGCQRGQEHNREGLGSALWRLRLTGRCHLVRAKGYYRPHVSSRTALLRPADSEWRRLGAEYWCERHITSAQAISLAMNPVIEYYLSERWPVIVEGAWITPADAARWTRQHEGLRTVFIHEREDLRTYLLSRPDQLTEHRGETFWLFGNWVREQALLNGLPVVNVHPRASLAERVLAAAQ